MSELSATVAAMVASGCSPDQISAVVAAHETARSDAIETKRAMRRAGNAARQQRHRDKNRNAHNAVTECDEALCAVTERDEVPSPCPPYEIINSTPPTPPSNSVSTRERNSAAADVFATRFWPAWPHKVGKPDAAKAFVKVAGEIDAILAGIDRYVATKPHDRQFMNPATFLNGRRWEDAPAVGVPERPPPGRRPSNPREAQAEFFNRMMYENDEQSGGFANESTIDGVASRQADGTPPVSERGRDDAGWKSGGFGVVTAFRR